jgi:hypothetical protein
MIGKFSNKLIITFLIGSGILLPLLFLNTSVSANQFDVVDSPPYYGIFPRETQYFAIINRDATTSLKINFTVTADEGAVHTTPNMVFDVFNWSTYLPDQPTGYRHVVISSESAETTLLCEYGHRYLIRISNLYTNPSDVFLYNISFITDIGVQIGDSGLFYAEQGGVAGEISVGFYYQADPWLYDSPDSDDRLALNFGWGPSFSELTWINGFGERYFGIWNVYEDVTLFVGVTGYPLNSFNEFPSLTIAVYDWVDMDNGITEPLEIAFTNVGVSNYSCGFNFTCKAGHVYEVYLKNDDSVYSIFANVTFFSWGQANLRFDDDMEPEPPTDQIRIRCFFNSPWLELRRSERELIWGWIFGTIGVIGVIVLAFIIKVRYF